MGLHHGMFSYFTLQSLFYNQNKKTKFFWENSGFLRMYLLVGYLFSFWSVIPACRESFLSTEWYVEERRKILDKPEWQDAIK